MPCTAIPAGRKRGWRIGGDPPYGDLMTNLNGNSFTQRLEIQKVLFVFVLVSRFQQRPPVQGNGAELQNNGAGRFDSFSIWRLHEGRD